MSKHLNQVSHNQKFIEHQCHHFCSSYFDWKVISAFYSAYHAIMALAESKKINIGKSHMAISKNINPTAKGAMPISKNCWANYRDLRVASESARYNGFHDLKTHEEQNFDNFSIAIEQMNHVIKYCKGKGLAVEPTEKEKTVNLISSP